MSVACSDFKDCQRMYVANAILSKMKGFPRMLVIYFFMSNLFQSVFVSCSKL